MDIVRDIAAIVGCISAIFALIALFSEKIRGGVKKIFTRQTREIVKINTLQNDEIETIKKILEKIEIQLNVLTESSKDIMRQRIMSIYHKNKAERRMPLYDREALNELYKDYKKEKGNNYIDKYFSRMEKWETVYTEDDDLD